MVWCLCCEGVLWRDPRPWDSGEGSGSLEARRSEVLFFETDYVAKPGWSGTISGSRRNVATTHHGPCLGQGWQRGLGFGLWAWAAEG